MSGGSGLFGIPTSTPNPFGLIPGPGGLIPGVGGTGGGGGLLGGILGGLSQMIEGAIAAAARSAFDQLEKLINSSAGSISFGVHSWWAANAAGAGGVWPTVVGVALAVLLACLVLAGIHGCLAGDPMVSLRAVAVEVPKSIFGMATVVALTGLLVAVTDQASRAVLANVGANFGDWFAESGAAGFFGGFVAALMLLGALLTWVELVVRQGLVFLLVALSPLALAVRVWPALSGLWRRFVELGVALIAAKFVIAVALALGSEALAGSAGTSGGASLTAMTTGAGLMLISALSPFVLLRIIPGVEGAVAAQGISRMPARSAMTAVSTATSAMLLARLASAGIGGRPAAFKPAEAPAPPPGGGGGSLARAAALDVASRPALRRGPDRGLPPPRPQPPGGGEGS